MRPPIPAGPADRTRTFPPLSGENFAATVVEGEVEQVMFTSPEGDFLIARVVAAGQKTAVTVCGPLAGIAPGQRVRLQGTWERHPRFGPQFRVTEGETFVPVTVEGIRRYLGSGVFPGLADKMAERIVNHFGADTLAIIENDPQRLAEVKGVGKKTIGKLRQAWEQQARTRGAMLFFQSHGVSAALARRIHQHYGPEAVARVRADPYALADDIDGIGFQTADRIARQMGIPADSTLRVTAALVHILKQRADGGHLFDPTEDLLGRCQKLVGCQRETAAEALACGVAAGKLVVEDLTGAPGSAAVFLKSLHHCEVQLALGLQRLVQAVPFRPSKGDVAKVLDRVQREMDLELAERQREAVMAALSGSVLVITGGPGTGKTTIVRAILRIYEGTGRRVRLAAPTGRAAKRLTESTGAEACTLHRLLEFSPRERRFQRNAERPLKADLLVVDEASMIDTVLMYHLVKALTPGTTLVLVGDVDQLPSVGPGNVLADIIASGVAAVVTLDEIFRQARQSLIVVNAHRINGGRMPLKAEADPSDFYFIEKGEPRAAVETILELVVRRIPRRFGFDPLEQIQVIAPMHRGVAGTDNLNVQLQAALNSGPGPDTGGRWRTGDKIMQIRNDYDKEVFNGDIGRVASAAVEGVTVVFDGRPVRYALNELDDLALAYAVSVHKSQGSEYPCIVMPLLRQHHLMLQRNLVYTAITRACRLVVIVGERRALAMAVANDRPRRRLTRLAERLAGMD